MPSAAEDEADGLPVSGAGREQQAEAGKGGQGRTGGGGTAHGKPQISWEVDETTLQV